MSATTTTTEALIELQPLDHHEATSKTQYPESRSLELPRSDPGRTLDSSPPASTQDASPNPPAEELPKPKLSTTQASLLILQLCTLNFTSNFCDGLLMIGLPTIAADLSLPPNLVLWPNSVHALAAASCILIAGTVADVIGPRRVNVPGRFIGAIFLLACGLSRTGTQLIVFRALQGMAGAIYSPSAIAIMSNNVAHGRLRNVGFASLYLMFPLGAGIGLVLGGMLVSTVGWRVGFYMSGGIGLCLSIGCLWTLPEDPRKLMGIKHTLGRLGREIDWVGAGMASASVTTFSYVLAMLSADTANIKDATNIGLLTFSVVLVPAFVAWMNYQTKHHKNALIPNAIWDKTSFRSVCVMIFLSNGYTSAMGLFCSFFFQNIQHLDALGAGLRLLPQAVVGSAMCILAGLYINKIPVIISVLISCFLAAIAPLLMALTNPAWPYWYTIFPAQLLAPIAIDVMFTVGVLVVTEAFGKGATAKGSAVFSTFSQLGSSLGLCVMSVISRGVTNAAQPKGTGSEEALLKGYRASFWTMFAWATAALLFAVVGLRKAGKVGLKKE